MKIDAWRTLTAYRTRTGLLASDDGDGNNGAFLLPVLKDVGGEIILSTSKHNHCILSVIVSDGMGWDHVSVSLPQRCPNWEEMCFVKDLFFEPHEVAMQLHPAESEYVNHHPYCLHIWRPQNRSIPTPPSIFVGPRKIEALTN